MVAREPGDRRHVVRLRPVARRAGLGREMAILIAYALSGVLLYLFYLPFDQWWYLRFMIPAIPVVLLLCAEAAASLTQWSIAARAAALMALLVAGGTHAIRFADSKDVLSNAEAEKRRYLDAAVYIDDTLPSDAVVLAMQHSGSIRYYTGRLTMRWDVLDPGSLDAAVAALNARDVPVYAAIESWEEEDFRRRFAGQHSIARLDRGAMAKSEDGEMRVYALSGDRAEIGPIAVIPRHDSGCVEGSRAFITPGAVRRLSTVTPGSASTAPLRGGQRVESLPHSVGLTAVALDRLLLRERQAVVHQPVARPQRPERRRAHPVRGAGELRGRQDRECRRRCRCRATGSRCRAGRSCCRAPRDRECAAVDHGSRGRGRDRRHMTGRAADLDEQRVPGRTSARDRAARRGLGRAHEVGERHDVHTVVFGIGDRVERGRRSARSRCSRAGRAGW